MRYKSRSRALAASALAASVGLAGLGLVAPAAQAAPAETDRIAGVDRYDTAADIATASYPAADTVVLTTGEKLPDALSANPIAGANDAPILLTLSDSIPASTQAALDGINPTNVIIVGGTAAVSAAVEAELEADGYTVTREDGVDRFATAAEVAREVGTAPDIDADGAGDQAAMATVALANGLTGLPDAVAASPMLHQMAIPLLLTGPDTLNEDAAAAIQALNAEQVLILGGTAAISLNIEQELQDDGISAERIADTDRFGTAAAIADFEVDFLGFDASTTYIASGFSLADALAGGPLASQTNSPIVLVSETSVPAPTATWLEERAAEIAEIIALGGTAVINDGVLEEAAQIADDGLAVTFDAQEAEAGSTLTGTLTGDFASAEIAGDCIEGTPQTVNSDDDTDADTEGVQFSVDISNTADAGDCVITVTFFDADGNEMGSETVTITVTEQPNAAATTRPELITAAIGATVTDAQVSASNPAGTRVSYTFDENIDLFGATGANFHVYNADGTQADTGNGAVLSRTDNTVVVNFPNLNTAASAVNLTLATVDFGAVTDDQGQQNPEGDAAVGSAAAPGTVGTAGITNAPDLLTVGNFRTAATAGFTAVDFSFDEAAFVTGVDGFDLVQINGTELDCAGPTTTNPSGGTSAGGNGTTTITVICENEPTGSVTTAPTLAAASTARGTVAEGTVGDATGGTGNLNELQAADVSNSGNTSDPDLVSAEFRPSAGTTDDQVLLVFDEAVTDAVDVNDIEVYDVLGNATPATSFDVNDANRTQVLVNVPDGTLADAVGVNILDGAVVASDNGTSNQQDEVGVTNAETSGGRTPGETAAPELRGVVLDQGTDAFGNATGFRATYTFDEPVQTTVVAGDFYLYLADGTRLQASNCTRVAATGTPAGTAGQDQVRCTAFVGSPTSATVGSAVVGTVDDGAVLAVDNGQTNPEGAERTTGGTGTPAQ